MIRVSADSPGSATPVSSTITQSTLSRCCATISSMAAIPRSFTEQQRHPFGRERNEVDWVEEEGSLRVRVRSGESATWSTRDVERTFDIYGIAKI